MTKSLVTVLLIFGALPAHAFSISEQSEASSVQFYQSLNLDGEFSLMPKRSVQSEEGDDDEDDEDDPFEWNLGATYQKFSMDTDGSTLTDHSTSLLAGLGWFGEDGLSIAGKFDHSATPEEMLSVQGGQLTVGFQDRYARASKDIFFTPYWGAKLVLAANNYTQNYDGEIIRKNGKAKPVTGSETLRQRMLGLDANWKPIRPFRVDFEVDWYGYNADVVNLENHLDTPAALQKGLGGFGETVGGLARVAYNLGLAYYINKTWDVSFYGQYSRLAADDSVSTDAKLTAHYAFSSSWSLAFGVENQASVTIRDTLGLLGFEYAN